ncbi:S8 family serine peptidase [Actinoplanes solisilvae]|uniref:S8 family serine peptidase n=1 Tax=Actinoplanes solisilvae TaxID=2486853 RepID=UPI000FD7F22B|nr:S8 family serine peptidase [Actinoplanes solisilvae]
MEWAAAAGAKVINMSLGGDPTDGTDPMSLAVDRVSAESGALFVIAAGNEGQEYTVGSPGAATSALTVGAVDRDDTLAPFSSRGPRLDEGLKPEISAPGVGIVAARAAGTEMGNPVDDLYTAASGTSMATPHVAGAAAILAQQHPGWTGAQLKDALVSTVKSTQSTVYQEGAGRVDVARAVSQRVTGTAVADFGLRFNGESPVIATRKVTYTNSGTTPVTLTLRSDVAVASVSPATLTVPAGGSADAVLSLDTGRRGVGRFGGRLTATAAGNVQVTTAIGGALDAPHRKVTFSAIGLDGRPAGVPTLQMFGDDPRFDVLAGLFEGQVGTIEVPEGDYLLNAQVPTSGEAACSRSTSRRRRRSARHVRVLVALAARRAPGRGRSAGDAGSAARQPVAVVPRVRRHAPVRPGRRRQEGARQGRGAVLGQRVHPDRRGHRGRSGRDPARTAARCQRRSAVGSGRPGTLGRAHGRAHQHRRAGDPRPGRPAGRFRRAHPDHGESLPVRRLAGLAAAGAGEGGAPGQRVQLAAHHRPLLGQRRSFRR